jgi:hypothetical protein
MAKWCFNCGEPVGEGDYDYIGHQLLRDIAIIVRAELAELAAQAATIAAYREALIWCSGSQDFNEGGVARVGWLKQCAPLLAGRPPGEGT